MHCKLPLGFMLVLATTAHAQFQFFENMFGGHPGGQQQQQQGNAPSDSNWYQQSWDQGMCLYTRGKAFHRASRLRPFFELISKKY
jgi:hypothetical protein